MSSQLHAQFLALHHAQHPLLLTNAWDAASARLWQELGAPAVATSSAAVAWSRGYADGGALPQSELVSSLAGMVRVNSVPLTADIEHGYSNDPQAVASLAGAIAAMGVVGINIEDGAGRPEELAAKIRAIRAALRGAPLFINARTDVYLRGLASGDAAVAMAIERLAIYREAGADGGFVPGLSSTQDAQTIAEAVGPLLLNVMALRGLPPAAELRSAGVRRISTGPFLFKAAFGSAKLAAQAFLYGDYTALFNPDLDGNAMNRMFETA